MEKLAERVAQTAWRVDSEDCLECSSNLASPWALLSGLYESRGRHEYLAYRD